MTLLKKLSFPSLCLLIGLSSCDPDDNGNQLAKDDAKAAIEDFNATTVSDLQELSGSTGVIALQDLTDLTSLDDPFGRIGTEKKDIKAFFQKKGKEFRSIFVPGKAIDGGRVQADTLNDPFDYQANLGIYSWNPQLGTEGEFERTGNSTIIEIHFPTEGSLTNNAELRLTAYEEVEFYDAESDELSYQPTLITASLKVDGTVVSSLDFDASFDEAGFPVTANINFVVNDFTMNLGFDGTAATSSVLNASLLHSGETIVATSVTVKYLDSSKSNESLSTIEGFVQFKNLKVQGDIDVKASDATEDLNEVVHLSLYKDNSKVGDIVFVDEDGSYIAYLKYADGTQEKLETILQPVVDEVDALVDSLD
jgi:hypothetical protein